ncbi:hypothetical protein XNA1_4970008 [Xenorhabdus nematophila str. Anatoliense]|nr:hypothetical protein XNA1_10008 [Xenorhabdus nematophila str. Anatoliense]CEE95148.1 hypothetical protein XNA1_4970008 [Xenorhabdus nematophila str. Anatoliense]
MLSNTGLPVPSSAQRIDLALTQGTPDLLFVFGVPLTMIAQRG